MAKSDGLQSELTEQCRLNGLGAEREARLMARVTELERAAVKAVMPLEGMALSGLLWGLPADAQTGILKAIEAVRATIPAK